MVTSLLEDNITTIANDYRNTKKTKLQRTFVSASDAAEDRARGTKRECGIVIDGPPRKSNKIEFVKSGQVIETESKSDTEDVIGDREDVIEDREDVIEDRADIIEDREIAKTETNTITEAGCENIETVDQETKNEWERIDYVSELSEVKCLDVKRFRHSMFGTRFGKLVLLVRSWAVKLWNIQSSCQVCGLKFEYIYNNDTSTSTVCINGIQVAKASGPTKQLAKKNVGDIAWNVIKQEAVMVLVKELFIAQNDARISVSDVSGKVRPKDDEFGTPVETSVATKMMKLMGWKGGGLGAEAQGIAEPIKPHLQMVNRAGLGSTSSDIRQIKRAAESLMRRYIASDCLDLDLVFSSDFSKEERAALHIVAKKAQLVSRSYGQGADRFLVVKKKLDPFSLVQAVIEKGGNTPKYQVFIPAALCNQPYNNRR